MGEWRDELLLNPGFFYPMPAALAFSDNHWGTAWILFDLPHLRV